MARLSSTTTGQDICEYVISLVENFELNPAKLCGLTTYGAPSMTGRTNRLTPQKLDTVGAQDVAVSHCTIHQEHLCTNVMQFVEAMKNIVKCVNYIRGRGLNHRQFKAFLEYLNCDYPIVVYFSAVHWLSRAAMLKRLLNIRQQTKLFMKSKHRNVAFLSDEIWMNDLAFLTDIAQHLSELNLKLQGKSQLANKLSEHISAFDTKLKLFQVQ